MPDQPNSRRRRWSLATSCGAAALVGAVAIIPSCEREQTPAAAAATPADGTARMVARLAQLIPAGNPGVNPTVGCDFRIDYFRRQRDQAPDLRARLNATLKLANDLLNCGRTLEAIAEFEQVRSQLQSPQAQPDPQSYRILHEFLSTSYLRLGEQENCLSRHGPDSCLLPIRGTGIHTMPRGSQLAIRELTALLELDPNHLPARWLLNLAYMTLGEYPDNVPPQWLIAPGVFASDYDIGRFANVATDLGLDLFGLSGGVIMEDFDRDGHLDLMASAWGARDQLRYFRSNGDGSFVERTNEAGLVGLLGGLNICHTDYDNDGYPDALILRGAWLRQDGHHPNSLLHNNGDGTFSDVTEYAGILSTHPTQTAAWGDFDNDGWVDLFIGNESTPGEEHPCELFRNNHDGTFASIAAAAGAAHVGFVKGVASGDYDNDGRLDLYLSQMQQPNVLLHNETPPGGQPRFRDVTSAAGVDEPLQSFPTWFFDYDNDGWLDLFVAPFPGFTANTLDQIAADYLGEPSTAPRPRLYRNNGDGTFRDVTREQGLFKAMLAMGANFGDLDNDGFLDIYIGTGEPNLRSLVPNRAYRNDGGRGFQNVTTSGGFGHLQKGHGIAFGDLDNDGDQDIYAVMGGAYTGDVAYNALFLNPGHGNHWVTLRLEGVRSNRAAVGARIRILADAPQGTRTMHATVGTGGSFGSSSLQQEIGLGDATSIRELEITWPLTGERQRIANLAVNRVYSIREGDPNAKQVE